MTSLALVRGRTSLTEEIAQPPGKPWWEPRPPQTPPLTLYPVTSDSFSMALTCSQLRNTLASVAFQTTFPGGWLGARSESEGLTGTELGGNCPWGREGAVREAVVQHLPRGRHSVQAEPENLKCKVDRAGQQSFLRWAHMSSVQPQTQDPGSRGARPHPPSSGPRARIWEEPRRTLCRGGDAHFPSVSGWEK